MKIHVLKIKEEYFMEILHGDKTFELRKNDRDYQLKELIHFVDEHGEEFAENLNLYQITYVLKDVPEYGLDEDYCILGIKEY